MRSLYNSFIIAVSIYSRIPMPKVEWSQKNMKYTLCFFSLFGVVIGALFYAWGRICMACGFGQVCFALFGTVIPIAVTGGVHLDGFMDTADALHSSEKKEKKLAILKDPYVGAFGVIALVGYCFLYGAGLTQIWQTEHLLLLALSFVISRSLSGMALVWFQGAKKEGVLYTFAAAAQKQTVRVVLVLVLGGCFICLILLSPVIGAVMALASMWVWTYYYYMSKNQFGGITGELAGYFLSLCELSSVLVIGFMGRVM